jgi:mono/diheme cytochrome c family protein
MRPFALLLSLTACSGGSRVDDILSLTGDATNGATVYADNCAACHAADGSGGIGPSLQGEASEEGGEEVVEVVLYGEDSMPAFPELTDQEVADLLAFLQQDL